MHTIRKNWETPSLINLDGSEVKSGIAAIPEGSHLVGSLSGSLPGLLDS